MPSIFNGCIITRLFVKWVIGLRWSTMNPLRTWNRPRVDTSTSPLRDDEFSLKWISPPITSSGVNDADS